MNSPFAVSEMAGYGRRSSQKRQRNSVARCVASDALPPLPQTRSFLPEARQFKTSFAARFSGSSKATSPRSVATESSIAFCKCAMRVINHECSCEEISKCELVELLNRITFQRFNHLTNPM